MLLPRQDAMIATSLITSVRYYAGVLTGVISEQTDPEAIINLPLDKVVRARDELFRNPEFFSVDIADARLEYLRD